MPTQPNRPEFSEVSTGVSFTHSKPDGSVPPMANTAELETVAADPKTRGVNPIMVYPSSQEQRDQIVAAAQREGLKLSPFLVFCAKQYINGINTKKK